MFFFLFESRKNLNINWDIPPKTTFSDQVSFSWISQKNHENSSYRLHGSPEMHFSTLATIAVFSFIINWKWRSRVGESVIAAILRLCKKSCIFDMVVLKMPFYHHKMHNFLPERLQSGLREWSLDTPVQPRTAQEGPRRAQEGPGRAQEAPGSRKMMLVFVDVLKNLNIT